jgi:signal transduction histidine kinase
LIIPLILTIILVIILNFIEGVAGYIISGTIIIILFAIIYTLIVLQKHLSEKERNFDEKSDKLHTLQEESIQLHTILQNIKDGIIITNINNAIIAYNSRVAEILQVDLVTHINHPITNLLPVTPSKEVIKDKQINLQPISGRDQIVSINSLPLVQNGQIIGTIYLIFDMTNEHQVEKMKLDFVTQAAHQLRTPLTIIRGYLSVLKDSSQNQLTPQNYQNLEKSLSSTEALLNLVENLLSVTLIEQGQLHPKLIQTSIEAILQDVLQKLSIEVNEKKIKLVLQKPPQPLPTLIADPYLISEALLNILFNSIQFSPPGEVITIDISAQQNAITLVFTDHGEGIPSDEIPRLFTKFYKVSDHLIQKTKGFGLGLYNAKAIIEAHHGSIAINSVLGSGASFVITLPLNNQTPPPDQVTSTIRY